MVWQRPKNVEYPKAWLRFESPKTKQKFQVRDLTPEYYDITLGYMTNMFLNESAIAKPLKILYDPIARKQMQDRWLNIVKENMAIICVTEEDIPRVTGIHLTLVKDREQSNGRHEPDNQKTAGQFSKFNRVVEELKNAGNLFDRFGADHYLGSLGLFVLPEFRGLGIATQMLKARIEMCRQLSLPGTATVFSTPGAQAAASKAGYQVLAQKKPEDCSYFTLENTITVMGTAIE